MHSEIQAGGLPLTEQVEVRFTTQ